MAELPGLLKIYQPLVDFKERRRLEQQQSNLDQLTAHQQQQMVNEAPAVMAALQARGVDTRQIPGLMGPMNQGTVPDTAEAREMGLTPGPIGGGGALQQGGTDIANQLLQNPATPMNQMNQQLQQEALLRQAEVDAGRFGSGLDYSQFSALNNRVSTISQGIGNAQFVVDVVGSTTPAQLRSPAMANARGQLQTAMFELYRPIQSLTESKDSVLREGERAAIDDFLGNPTAFISSLMTFDQTTIGKMQKLADALERNRRMSIQGLDQTTLGLLAPALQTPRNPFDARQFQSIRDPQAGTAQGFINPATGEEVPQEAIEAEAGRQRKRREQAPLFMPPGIGKF